MRRSGSLPMLAFVALGAVVAVLGPFGTAVGKHSYVGIYSYLAASNDHFAGPQVISGRSGTAGGSTLGASKEPLEPHHAGNPGGGSLWFLWVAPDSGPANFNTAGSDFDTLLAAYTGDAFGDLALVDEDDDSGPGLTSSIGFPAVKGTAYRVAVDGYASTSLGEFIGGANGNYVLGWNLPVPPIPPAPQPSAPKPIDPRCGQPGVVCGTDGPDQLIGTPGGDLIIGGAGDDLCLGRGGDDTIICGAGNDVIDGGSGDDLLSSTSGNDVIRGGAGKDRLAGGEGADRLFGGAGRDRLAGEDGRDFLNGGKGRDRCRGGPGKDRLKDCER